jgi:CO/xanthine dehydrogenase FAD-binding subunit
MFHQPLDIDDALGLRAQYPDATVINGATDISVAMNHDTFHPRAFIDLSRIATLRALNHDGEMFVMGAGVTFAQLGRNHLRALREASLSVAGPAIRNMGTIGGNLVTASPAGDGCVALLAMGGTVELTNHERGPRWVDIREFFVGYRRTALAADELVTRVRVPYNPATRWYKIGKRGAVNISIVCCAAARRPDGTYGIAFGCVGPTPLFAPKAEAVLGAGPLTPELIAAAADTAATEVAPIDDHRGSAAYRTAMCRTLSQRLLADLAANDGKGDADAFSTGAAA